ncbi:MAG: hypothetical protein Q4F65_05840 [Propionibacteriaceae bacterium]|nr:hypothetical protein [Propionibacteriaceae bacterium]
MILNGMATADDGKWAAFEVGVEVARQNGKNGSIEVVELGWMINEPGVSILHTAHDFNTALESMQRLEDLLRSNAAIESEFKPKPRYGNGRESIRLANGSIIRFKTRTKSGGRGFSVDRLVIDEAMIYSSASRAAIMPLLTASENPQIWYLGSAPDAETHEHSAKWFGLRARALERRGSLCWMEWSAPEPDPEWSEDERQAWREDRENWACANPSLGFRVPGLVLTEKYIADEMDAFADDLAKWEVERLGIPIALPDAAELDEFQPLFPDETLGRLFSGESVGLSHTVLALDASPDRAWCSIAAAGRAGDRVHGLVGYHGALHVDSVLAAVLEAIADADPVAILVDPKSPAELLIDPIERAGFEVHRMTWAEVKSATGALLAGVDDGRYSLAESPVLREALGVATLREDRDGGVALARQSGTICQLVATAAAMWGVDRFAPLPKEPVRPAAGVRAVPVSRDRGFAF